VAQLAALVAQAESGEAQADFKAESVLRTLLRVTSQPHRCNMTFSPCDFIVTMFIDLHGFNPAVTG
jgi:hypothetical protein